MQRSVVLVAGLVLMLASPALASHAGQYARNPVEHDDQGRSDEPDFAATSVFGPPLSNRVLDLDRDGVAAPDPQLPPPQPSSRVLAPGCTDPAGRQPSGLCGLNTIGVGVLEPGDVVPPGLLGVDVALAYGPPGGYTPTRATVVRFLDLRVDAQLSVAGATRLDLNHKVADLHHPSLLAPSFTGSTALWAWLGDWQDKNANGVIDHLGDSQGQVRPENEFVWRGACRPFDGGPPNPGPHCAADPPPAGLLGYVFPGEHHARCGLYALSYYPCIAPGDLPGSAAKCYLVGLAGLGGAGPCDPGEANGDPLLGPQGGVAPDGAFADYTGDRNSALRGWYYDNGWSTWFYDGSVAVSHVLVAAYGAPADPAHPNRARLGEARFLDVDHHRALQPDLDALLQGQLKPAARDGYLFLRDVAGWTKATAEEAGRTARSTLGPADDGLWDPGWSHEPNTPGDVHPGARFRAFPPEPDADPDAAHHGWLNDYAGYRERPRAWLDLQSYREVLNNRALSVGPACLMCVTGPGVTSEASPEPMQGHAFPRPDGDHARALGTGIHHFVGRSGTWHDRPQTVQVTYVDLAGLAVRTTTHALPPDRWVGNLLDLTGARGGAEGLVLDVCTIGGQRGSYPWGWCHPYLDGALDDPNQYPYLGSEFTGECGHGPSRLRLEPEGGAWHVPVFVWRDTWALEPLEYWEVELEDHTGGGAVELWMGCYADGRLRGYDALVLPLGNLGQRVTTRLTFDVAGERVVDVDVYEPWGA